MTLLHLVACSLHLVSEPPPEPAPVWTIPDLWSSEAPSGERLTVAEAVVISPRTADGTTFYAQHPGGGPHSGLQVRVGDGLNAWPPLVGTPVELSGVVVRSGGGPTLWLDDQQDLVVLGDPGPVAPFPFAADVSLVWSLVTAEGVRISSSVDPAGIATTDLGYHLRPDFGVAAPGWNRTGDLVAVMGLAYGLLLRSPEDWTGGWTGDPPLAYTFPGLHGLPDGTPVIVSDVVQATPWSRGGRYAVIQDAAGRGVWVDAEGFGAPASDEGDVGTWVGEVAYGDDGARLRVWNDPTLVGTRAPLEHAGDPLLAPPGALVTAEVSGLLPVGPRGDRYADPWLLDDRFVPVDDLTDPALVQGAVRVDGVGTRRLARLPD